MCLIFSARDYVVACRDTRGVRVHRYNPYTEPSMEIFHWHHGLNKYVEIGNSGPPHTHATCIRKHLDETCSSVYCHRITSQRIAYLAQVLKSNRRVSNLIGHLT